MNASGAIPIVCGRMVPSRSGMVVWAPHAISSRISNLVITLDGMASSIELKTQIGSYRGDYCHT